MTATGEGRVPTSVTLRPMSATESKSGRLAPSVRMQTILRRQPDGHAR